MGGASHSEHGTGGLRYRRQNQRTKVGEEQMNFDVVRSIDDLRSILGRSRLHASERLRREVNEGLFSLLPGTASEGGVDVAM